MSGIPAGAGQLLGKRLGKFEIVALLALGGTAEIYLARIGGAAGFEKYVVVKCLHDHLADDAEFVKMFLDEARLAAHLDHSNIVQTMELGNHEGRYYMVMEFLAGLSLAMIIRRASERMADTRVPVPVVLNILAQSAAGLHYAHEKAMNGRALNIVHRDISPQNLVISFEGVVKLVDFGIAKAEMRETRTRSGTIKGKFAYMSPEQCVANNVDRRTDVFALGVIGHELLTGRRLFKRPSPYETYQAVIECDVKPPSVLEPTIDPELDAVIMRALTKDKADRYPSAEAFGDSLLGYLHYRSIGSGPGDVSRFFEAHFGQELDEHSARMRELISGRDVAIESVKWDAEEDDDARQAREAAAAYALDDLGDGSRAEDDDEMPAERTRIETNPLERVNELERMLANNPPRQGKSSTPPGMVPAQFAGLPSGRFPDLANLPTQIAPEGDRPISGPPPTTGFVSHALTDASQAAVGVVGAASVPPSIAGFGHAPTAPAPSIFAKPGKHPTAAAVAPPDASAFANVPTTLSPPSFDDELRETQLVPVVGPNGAAHEAASPSHASQMPTMPPTMSPIAQHSSSSPTASPMSPTLAPGSPSPLAMGYPVMNAQMSEQIATGATVFPSDRSPALFAPGDPRAPAPVPPSAPSPAHAGPAIARSGPRSVEAGGSMPHEVQSDAQRAAALMSPVGEHFPGQVDWSAAAAAKARAVPTWLLAILFIAAIGVALAFTIVIARLVR
ncbi:MAG TPA: protein kinase [Kofleriaceae bacterium]|nr:protein kinase [Kofleriaceae bacterium]